VQTLQPRSAQLLVLSSVQPSVHWLARWWVHPWVQLLVHSSVQLGLTLAQKLGLRLVLLLVKHSSVHWLARWSVQPSVHWLTGWLVQMSVQDFLFLPTYDTYYHYAQLFHCKSLRACSCCAANTFHLTFE
jgi:hypothetical protein